VRLLVGVVSQIIKRKRLLDARSPRISAIESAREGFDSAVSEIPSSDSLGDAQLALQNAFEGFFEAVGPALDTQCPAAE
jgi:hypothetical protein